MRTLSRTLSGLAAATLMAAGAASAQTNVGWMELEGAPAERPGPFDWLMGSATFTLNDYTTALDEASQRRDLEGLVIRLREAALSRIQVEELGAAIERFRETGKHVHLFTEIYGPNDLLLGSYADEIIVQQGGAISLPGIYMEEMFLADTLAMVGLKADFVQVGDYKGASEQMGRSEPSDEWDQNISQLLDGLYDAMRDQLTDGRDMSDEELDRAMEEAWFLDPDRGVELGLVDAVVDRLDLDAHLKKQYGEIEYDTNVAPQEGDLALDAANPFAILQMLSETPSHRITRDSIAVVHIDGAIVDGESQEATAFGGGTVGSLTIREALAKIEHEDKIKGLVLRINSPGGSAIASESIWLGVRRVADKKPVWVSVGSMAASGGYYIAVSGDRIYVNPSSIVGSIGVVGGKYTMGGLYEKIQATIVPRARGPRADLFSSLGAWSDTERALVRDRMTETYDLFIDRVKQGRSGIRISKTAEGRLFTGDRAINLRMADAMGGYDDVMTDFADHLALDEGDYDVFVYPEPKSFSDFLESAFGGFVEAPGVKTERPSVLLSEGAKLLRELVGEQSWPAMRDALNAMLELRREQVLLVSPRVLLMK